MSLAYGIGGLLTVPPPVLRGQGAPLSTFIGQVGQQYFDISQSPPQLYIYNGQTWGSFGASDVTSITGTAGQIAASSSTGSVTLSTPAAFVAPGSIASTTTITVGSTLALPGPVFVYTGAGAPSNALALHVGDLYINTTAASAVTRMYIATSVGAWTNVTCAA